MDKCSIRFKVFFNEALTSEEEAIYLTVMANAEEKRKYLAHKKKLDRAYNKLVRELKSKNV